tara:strand:- start:849 stop:1211 length:363 start_codon:yes stop_codon:yes gene_type:complete
MNLFLAAFLLLIIFSGLFFGLKPKSSIEGLANKKELVLVHMNGCPHCISLMPEWKQATKDNTTNISMRAVEMNDDDGPELCKKHNINGFPTIILLNNGKKISDYEGERNKDGILQFLQSH